MTETIYILSSSGSLEVVILGCLTWTSSVSQCILSVTGS
jgi:hypothetical protein